MNPIIKTKIEGQINNSKVVVYMKGTPEMPQCGFSSATVQILRSLGYPFASVNVLEDQEVRQGIKEFSNWPTIPQVYIAGEFVGGCDILQEMHHKGELESLLKSVYG